MTTTKQSDTAITTEDTPMNKRKHSGFKTMPPSAIIQKWNRADYADKAAMLGNFKDAYKLRIACWWHELPVDAQSFLLKNTGA